MDTQLRKLARSSCWQLIYNSSKKCANIQIFDNVSNFSGLQSRFLHWLFVYDMLFEEIAKHESKFLTENVIENDYRCDAYLTYRYKKHDYSWKQHRREERLREIQTRNKNNQHSSGDKQQVCNVEFRRE